MFTSGKTTTANTYTPAQTSLQKQALGTLSSDLSNPDAMFQPIESAGISSIDSSYKGVMDSMNRELASRGFTSSGTTGFNTEKILSQRAGDVGKFEGNLATTKLNQNNTLLTDALNAAFKASGSTSETQSPFLPTLLSGGLSALLGGLNKMGGSGGGGGGSAPSGSVWGDNMGG